MSRPWGQCLVRSCRAKDIRDFVRLIHVKNFGKITVHEEERREIEYCPLVFRHITHDNTRDKGVAHGKFVESDSLGGQFRPEKIEM